MNATTPRALRLAAAFFAFAAAALAWGGGSPSLVRVLAGDVSRSVRGDSVGWAHAMDLADGGISGSDTVGLLCFGAGVDVLRHPSTGSLGSARFDVVAGDGRETDIEAGIRGALALIPEGAAGEILLATDGRATRGDAAAAVAEARRRGVAIRTVPLGAKGLPARAAAVEAPAAVRAGDRFPISVLVTGSAGAEMEVVLEDVAAGEAERRAVVVPAGGRARVVFARTAGRPGVRRYRSGGAEAAVLVEGEAAVLRVGREPAGPGVTDLLKRLGGGAFQDGGFEGADLSALACVVLDDIPESSLSPDGGERLRRAVEGGLGLVVLGGAHTLGPGGFAGRPIEDPLPVRCAPDRPRPLLVLAVDVSGSMESSAAAARKAAADLAMRLPSDARLALVFFHDGLAATAGPFDLADPAGREAASTEAARVRPSGGGTRFGAAAEGALASAAGATGGGARRLLVVTDGRPVEEETELGRIAKSLADARFNVKVVTVGEDSDPSRLHAFAGEGGVLRAAPEDLAAVLGSLSGNADPALFDPATASVRAGPDAPPFGAVPAGLPPVSGFDRVFPCKGARVWLATGGGEPLLAARQAGLGRSVVFAAAPGAGPGEWAAAPAAAVLEAAFRWSLRAPGGEGAEARARLRPDGILELRIETFPGTALAGEMRAAGVVLPRTGTSTWEGTAPREAAGPEGVVVFAAGGAILGRVAVSPSPSAEDRLLGPDAAALAAMETPGREAPGRKSGAGPAAMASALAALALLLVAAGADARSSPRGPSV